ncbi:LOW QUALITY PROTEIN: nuclear pore complex protein Nup153-like [Erethizon dorsatum]
MGQTVMEEESEALVAVVSGVEERSASDFAIRDQLSFTSGGPHGARWLQKYFSKNEEACGCSTDTKEVPQGSENRDDPVVYVDEDNSNISDAQSAPEPAVSNAEASSTSGTASKALPGGSCTEMRESTSQGRNSPTTSCSSRAPHEDSAVSHNTPGPPLGSPEAECAHSVSQHSTTSSKTARNLSGFGILSPSLANSSNPKTGQLRGSPFYHGKTRGGAAAAPRPSQLRNTPYQVPVRKVQAKPLHVQSYDVTSLTARRILRFLETASSFGNVDTIPPVFSSLNSLVRTGSDITDMQAKRAKGNSPYLAVQKPTTPEPVSTGTKEAVSFKLPLTPSSELRETGERTDKKDGTGNERNMIPRQNRQPESGFPYPNFSVPAADGSCSGGGGRGGKKTREVASKPLEDEETEVLVVPKLSVPITSSSVPTGNLLSAEITASPSSMSSSRSLANKVQMTSLSSTSSPVFRFSSPIIISKEAVVLPPSFTPFTSSVPTAKTELSGPSRALEPILRSSTQDSTAGNRTNCKRKNEGSESLSRPTKLLKDGGVLDVQESPAGLTGQRGDSLAAQPTTVGPGVYTKPASRKSAERTEIGTPSKSGKATLPASGTGSGDKFKSAIGIDCDTCLVQNKSEARRCVACETSKPEISMKRGLRGTAVSESAFTRTTSSSRSTFTSGTSRLRGKFKRPVGSWQCPLCCVSNNAEDNTCVSCMAEKPASGPASSSAVPALSSSRDCLGLDKLKRPEGKWDCEVCLVQNKSDATKCVACESAKPGMKSHFGFGISPSTLNPVASSFKCNPSFSFGPSQTITNTGNFKFGDQRGFKGRASSDSGFIQPMSDGFKISKQTGDFKFGGPELGNYGVLFYNACFVIIPTFLTSVSTGDLQ